MTDITSTQKKIIAVAIVAIIIVAGVAVYFTNANHSTKSATHINSELMVCGNANEDYTIDSQDLAIAQDVINGKKTLADYPLADANNDGKVDSADTALIQKLINRESATIYVVCLDRSGNETKVAVQYPLTNVVPFGTNITEPLLDVGGGKSCAGYFYSSYANADKSMTANAVDLGGKGRAISDTAWKNFIALDTKLATTGGVGALLVDYSGISAITDSYAADLTSAGIPMIIYAPADAYDEITAALTLGFLLGGTSEQYGVTYAKLSWAISDEISAKVKGIADKDLRSYICLTMGIFVCQNDSTFNVTPSYAGGVPYYKVNAAFATAYAGNSSVKMASTEALANYGDADCIISNRSVDYGVTDKTTTAVQYWEKYVSYFEKLSNYEGLSYVNNLLPGVCKIAYMAYVLYPTVFTLDWANSVMQQFIDEFVPFSGYTLDNIVTVFTYDDYKNAKSSS